MPIKETRRPNLTVLDLQLFILEDIRKKEEEQVKDLLTLALLGPSIQGSIIFIGPSTLPTFPSSTSPELSDPDLMIF
jgi:hypothetical protein